MHRFGINKVQMSFLSESMNKHKGIIMLKYVIKSLKTSTSH